MEILSEAGGRRGRKASFRPYMAQSRKQTRFFSCFFFFLFFLFFFLFFSFFSFFFLFSFFFFFFLLPLSIPLYIFGFLASGCMSILSNHVYDGVCWVLILLCNRTADSLNRAELCCSVATAATHLFYCWRSGPANKRLRWGRSQSTEPNVRYGVWAVEEKGKTIGSMNCMRSCKVQKFSTIDCILATVLRWLSRFGLDGWMDLDGVEWMMSYKLDWIGWIWADLDGSGWVRMDECWCVRMGIDSFTHSLIHRRGMPTACSESDRIS